MFKELAEINEENLYVNDDAFIKDREEEKSGNTKTDYQIAALKNKIKHLREDIDDKNKTFEKLFSLYYDKHPKEIEEIVRLGLLRT